LVGQKISVPGDISSAAFFLVAGLLIPHSIVTVVNLSLNPTRTGILDALTLMGAELKVEGSEILNQEPRGNVVVESQQFYPVEISGKIIPRIIDEIPILAVAATQAQGMTTIKDAKELRVKETDRIRATCKNLHQMGADIQEHEDGFTINGPSRLNGAEVDSYGDHRIAMAFAIAGLLAKGETKIKNADCVDISYPGFFQVLDSLRYD
jgi:3-phosphoshikimate 1-carboxyvinyltransferase